MDIKVQSVRQSEAPLEAFGSYSQQINTRSTFGDSLQRLGQNLNIIKQRKQKESDTLTADRLYSDWSAQSTLAGKLLESKDPNEVKRGRELSNSLNPDTFDFKGYAEANNLAPLYDEESFAKYKNRAREHWTVQQGLADIREADRNRATNLKNAVDSYSQDFSNNLDFEKGYDPDFLIGKIDYLSSETYNSVISTAGEELASTVHINHTDSLVEAIRHQFHVAKTPAEYDAAMEVLEYANEKISQDMYRDELTSTLGSTITQANKRVNDSNSMLGLYKTASNDITNKVNTISEVNSVLDKATKAEEIYNDIVTTRETHADVITSGSSDDLKQQSEANYVSMYMMSDDGTSVFYAVVSSLLAGEDPMYDVVLESLQPTHQSKFKDDVTTFIKDFRTKLENGDPQAFAMIDPDFASTYNRHKQGLAKPGELRIAYNNAKSVVEQIPNLVIPEFYVPNATNETFPEASDVIGRRNYIEEMASNNDVEGLYAASRNPKISKEEELMLRYTAFQISSGVSPTEVGETALWWANTFSDTSLEYSTKIEDIVSELLEDPSQYDSEMFSLYRVYTKSGEYDMADAYLQGFKQLLNDAYKQNPAFNKNQAIKYAKDLEKKYLTSQGVYRSVNGRDTFIPSELYTHIDPNMNPSLISGPLQLIEDRLNVDNGLRAVESAVYVQVAKQMEDILPNAIETAIIADPKLVREFMPDLYDTMSEEEIAELEQAQRAYAMSGITPVGVAMPGYDAIRRYLTEDKRKEIARGLYFNTYRIGTEDKPIASLEYTEHNGQRGYRVRLLNTNTGKYTYYLQDADKKKAFVPISDIKSSVDHAKKRHTRVGIARDRSEDTGLIANPSVGMTYDVTTSFFDSFSGLFMKDNRFMDAILDFNDIR